MSYLPEKNTVTLKNNINTLIKNKSIDINELTEDLDVSRDTFNQIINVKSNREISPDMFASIEIYCLGNDIDIDNLLGPIPEKYGERLKYFIFKHHLTQSEFSRKCCISSATLWNMFADKIQIGNKYKERMCTVLEPKEFDLLSSYGDVTIPEDIDMNVVKGCNISWNMYGYLSKFHKFDLLFSELKISKKDYDKFVAGTIKLTKPKIKLIAKYLKCTEDDLTQDSLNLTNIKNRFGYWLASKIYAQNNSISMFADRCLIDENYLADIIKGECLIKDKDIENIAIHLGVDPDAFVQICPESDMDLVPIAEEKMTLNEIVRARIANLGYTFKEFCAVMDINYNTMATALHSGKLPLKNRDDVILELDLQDRFPLSNTKDSVKEEVVEKPVQSVEEQIKEDIEDNEATNIPYIPISALEPDILSELSAEEMSEFLNQSEETTDNEVEVEEEVEETPEEEISVPDVSLDNIDVENMLSIMYHSNYPYQVSLAKFICHITHTEFTEDLTGDNIVGLLNRMNLIKDNL